MPTVTELRNRLAGVPGCQLVTADIYIECLTGHRPMVRSDEPHANLAGLLDEATGQRILVPMEDLARSRTLATMQLN